MRYKVNQKHHKMTKIINLFGRCDTMVLRVAKKGYSPMPSKDLQYYKENCVELRKKFIKEILSYELEINPCKIDFDQMYDDMLKEYLAYYDKSYVNVDNSNYSSIAYLFSDAYMTIYSNELRAKYKVSETIWEWTCENVEGTVIFMREILPNIEEVGSLEVEALDLPENAPLKNNLIGYEYDVSLTLWVYFKFNEETKKWLLRYRLDSDLFRTGLEDLILLKNGNEKFASISHEGMNTIDKRHIKKRYLH